MFRRGVDMVGASVWWRSSGIGLGMAAACCSAPHAAPLPLKAFFEPPASRGAQLSPSGRYLALIETGDRGDLVSILDLQTRDRSVALRPKGGRAVDWVRWKDDDRLVTGLASANASTSEEDGADGPDELLTALDRDGGKPISLSPAQARAAQASARPGKRVRMADALRTDPGHVLVVAPDSKGASGLWKVDVHSGSAEFVGPGEDDPDSRLPRGAMVVRYDVKAQSETEFEILGPAEGGKKAFVALQPRSKAEGDTASLRIYDFQRKSFSDPVWPALKYDVSDVVYREADRSLAGVCYTADAFECDFKDPALKADYARARAAFKGERSLTPLSMSDDGRYWLFGVSGPDEAGAYYVFDRKSHRMTLAADRHPALPSSKLGPMEKIVYRGRDGTEIPGYLTRPPNAPKGPLPLIVMPHGGPEARDSYAFDIWTQYFATRGYLVFQPNFRGSSGYGRSWAEAGYGQWGARMQDDITDGVRHLIDSGTADAQRVCIFGASFGGYAALYGGAQTPELYKCVASFAGVADLKALVEWEKSTPGHGPRFRYASRAIGDPRKDAARLAAVSPVRFAARYKLPVLLIHGSQDASVPVAQSQAMERALRKAGKDVRLVVYEGEGHSDWSADHEQAALAEIAGFIGKHIAPARTGS